MKDLVVKFRLKINRSFLFLGYTIMSLAALSVPSFAAPGNQNPDVAFDATINFIAGWVNKFGFAIAFIGAIMFAMGFRNDDAEGKTKGLRTLITGFIVAAVSLKVVYNGIFGLGTP